MLGSEKNLKVSCTFRDRRSEGLSLSSCWESTPRQIGRRVGARFCNAGHQESRDDTAALSYRTVSLCVSQNPPFE